MDIYIYVRRVFCEVGGMYIDGCGDDDGEVSNCFCVEGWMEMIYYIYEWYVGSVL